MLTLQPGQRFVCLGDSLTFLNTWYQDLAVASNAIYGNSTLIGNVSAASGPPLAIRGSSRQIWINSGVSGDDCTNIVGAIASRVTTYRPDVVIIFVGVNCVQHAVSDATCTTNHASINSQILAGNPGVQILCMSPLCIGENWPQGANGNDTALDAKASIIATAAANSGATYVDLRTPFFAWQAINNPAHDGGGHLTADTIHLSIPLGRSWVSGIVGGPTYVKYL